MSEAHTAISKFALYFVDQVFLQLTSNDVDATSRSIISDFIQDLLTVLYLPEWPAAEVLLFRVCGKLTTLSKADANVPASVRTLCVDQLGDIIARLKRHVLEAHQASLFSAAPAEVKLNAGPLDHGEVVACICGATNETVATNSNFSFMLDCDRCHRWSHGICVGFETKEELQAVPDKWYCDSCKLHLEVEAQRKLAAATLRKRSTSFGSISSSQSQEASANSQNSDSSFEEYIAVNVLTKARVLSDGPDVTQTVLP